MAYRIRLEVKNDEAPDDRNIVNIQYTLSALELERIEKNGISKKDVFEKVFNDMYHELTRLELYNILKEE